MGTNYYLHRDVCESCGRPKSDPLHIGKSSAGWTFGLHVVPDDGISSLGDWLRVFLEARTLIRDEYGKTIAPVEMLEIILCRWRDKPLTDFDWESNYAVPGPNNLIRHKLDDRYCSGHGDGPYDLILGEFC